jgi:hypothetical protein
MWREGRPTELSDAARVGNPLETSSPTLSFADVFATALNYLLVVS